MKIDRETVQKVYEQLRAACEVIVQYVRQVWDRIKGFAIDYMEYKLERTQRPVYGYVKHRVMKSQVIDRKPRCIRARTVC